MLLNFVLLFLGISIGLAAGSTDTKPRLRTMPMPKKKSYFRDAGDNWELNRLKSKLHIMQMQNIYLEEMIARREMDYGRHSKLYGPKRKMSKRKKASRK